MPADPTTLNAFALSCALLAVNLNILWFSSANARLRTGTVASPEDAGLFVKGSVFPPSEPEAVARILRAHSNALATTVPFVMVAGSYVAVGGASAWAPVLFGTFVVARFAHAFVYLRALQPWRTIAFAIGMVATVTTLVMLLVQIVTA